MFGTYADTACTDLFFKPQCVGSCFSFPSKVLGLLSNKHGMILRYENLEFVTPSPERV